MNNLTEDVKFGMKRSNSILVPSSLFSVALVRVRITLPLLLPPPHSHLFTPNFPIFYPIPYFYSLVRRLRESFPLLMLPSYNLAAVLPVSQSPVRSLSVQRNGGSTTIISCSQQPPFVTRVTIDFETKHMDIKAFNELSISGQVTASVLLSNGMVAVGGLDKEVRWHPLLS